MLTSIRLIARTNLTNYVSRLFTAFERRYVLRRRYPSSGRSNNLRDGRFAGCARPGEKMMRKKFLIAGLSAIRLAESREATH